MAQKMPAPDRREGRNVGDIAYDFSLKDLDGRVYSLKKMRGERVVQVVFWATWCVPCIEEIPTLREAYEKYRGRGFELFGVVVPINQTTEGVRAFAEKFRINYPILWDEDGTMTDKYRVGSIPQTFLIDKSGIIRHAGGHLPGGYERMLEDLLRDGGAPNAAAR